MSYRIVYPVSTPIDGSSFTDAVKKYIKLNHFMNIEQLILTDQYRHMQANIKYGMRDNGRRNASIQLLPIAPSAIPAMVGFSSTDPKAPYPGRYVVGPLSIGAPASIVAPAPVMVARPAAVGLPMVGGPGGPAISGMIFGARKEEKQATTTTAPSATDAIFGPTHVITSSRQILPIKPVTPIGTDGKPITGVPVPFGVGVSAYGRPVPFVGGPLPAPVGLMPMASPVHFGMGL
jgi:hypothetical protein